MQRARRAMANQRAGKAASDSPTLKPYPGKPAVRNFRGDGGNAGIIEARLAPPSYSTGLAPGGARDEGRRRLPCRVKLRSSQYLNNMVEQDHRRVKQRIRPMLGFKRFDNAVVTISGIELAEKIKKGQFKTGKLGGCDATMTELWNAALAIRVFM